MSGFTSTGPQASSAPSSSALDIVPPQTMSGWDALLSPNVDSSTHEDADPSFLINSQSFSELDNTTTGGNSDAFSWDSTPFSSAHLRPTTASMSDLHTPSQALMSLESTNYGVYPYSKSHKFNGGRSPVITRLTQGSADLMPSLVPATSGFKRGSLRSILLHYSNNPSNNHQPFRSIPLSSRPAPLRANPSLRYGCTA